MPPRDRAIAAALAAPSAELEIHLQRKKQKDLSKVLTEDDIPLRDGDKLQFHGYIEGGGYVYIYYYDAEGMPTRLWPDRDEPLKISSRSPKSGAPRTRKKLGQRVVGGRRRAGHRVGDHAGCRRAAFGQAACRIRGPAIQRFRPN